ncbi:hypothetical protein, partial [Flavobacterium sp. ZB4R12]|uniref:hypothetical protein n=1 Tax=Flavobacterium sp. ZB4R12 TaxID=3398732 RepID=UPI003AABC3EB
MKKNYFCIILLFLSTLYSFGQCHTLSGDNKVCINTTETYTTVSGESNYIWTFAGGTISSGGLLSDNTITIVWGSTAGNYNVNVTFDGAPSSSCGGTATATLIVSVNVKPNTPSVSPLSYCLNAASDIEDAITGSLTDLLWYTVSTGGTSTPIPPTIDTGVAGITSYWVSRDGGGPSCESNRAEIVVTINPSTGATSFTAGATTVCQNAADETYTATAANSTSIAYSVLPAAAGVINTTTGIMDWDAAFSGTATITATSTGLCGTTTANRAVTVTPNNTITLSSAVATANQTLCITTPITNITYSTARATGATFSGLPTGVTGSWSGNTVTISGSPSVAGTFNYTVTLTGGCGTITTTGTITVTPNNTAGVASTTPTLCISTLLINITHATTGATGIAAAVGLPAGV